MFGLSRPADSTRFGEQLLWSAFCLFNIGRKEKKRHISCILQTCTDVRWTAKRHSLLSDHRREAQSARQLPVGSTGVPVLGTHRRIEQTNNRLLPVRWREKKALVCRSENTRSYTSPLAVRVHMRALRCRTKMLERKTTSMCMCFSVDRRETAERPLCTSKRRRLKHANE